MANNIIAPKQVVNEEIELTEFGESLLVKGTIITNEDESGVLTTGFLNAITVDTTGLIRSETTAIQVEGEATNINNLGKIFGGFNGIQCC